MRTIDSDVKSRSEVVGTASHVVYDSVAEACEHLGEKTTLDCINKWERERECNKIRAAKTGKPSKSTMLNEALVMATPDEAREIAGDPRALDRLRAKYLPQIMEKYGIAQDEDPDD